MMLSLLFAVVATVSGQYEQKLMMKNLQKGEDLAVYYLGQTEGLLDGSETYCQTVTPGSTAARYVKLNDSFVFRAGDMVWRSRVSLYAHDDETRP